MVDFVDVDGDPMVAMGERVAAYKKAANGRYYSYGDHLVAIKKKIKKTQKHKIRVSFKNLPKKEKIRQIDAFKKMGYTIIVT